MKLDYFYKKGLHENYMKDYKNWLGWWEGLLPNLCYTITNILKA